MKEKLKKFIKDNKLKFDSSDYMNTDLVVLLGYSLYLNNGDRNTKMLNNILQPYFEVEPNLKDQFERLDTYTYNASYADWWDNEDNRNQYKT